MKIEGVFIPCAIIACRLLSEGRLELLTGGLVMPDETLTHNSAVWDQLVRGHAWIKHNLSNCEVMLYLQQM